VQLFICLVFGLTLGLSSSGHSAETNPPPSRASSSSAAVGTNLFQSFQLEKGFRIELVASDPMVESPVAMAFDENGRLFVVERRTSDGRGARSGRVRMLDNMNEEGVFQNSTIYADGLDWPSAVACYAGGIFVAAAPDIFYLKDTKSDGIADARQVVINGFGGTNTLDPNLLPNNFNWGPDNRIHGASAGIGGDLSPEDAGSGAASITRCDFSFDPRTLEVFAESGPAESGLSFDSRGRKFVCDFLRPLLSPMYEVRYTLRNPFYPRPPALGVVADPDLPIYRFIARPPRDESGRQATNVVATGRMTSARGCVVYRGRAFPTSYFDNVFIADPEAHVIRRLVLHEEGITVTAQRPANESNTEFLISRDPSFRPVQLINGPDGALYIADMQNGNDRGRIYRILPDKFKRAKPAQLGKVKTYDLVSTLAQGDGWHRDTAARLLYERKDPAAPALLRGTLNRAGSPQARVLALHALVGASALTEDDALQALRDPDDRVREHGLLASETLFKNGDASDALLSQLGALAMDPSLRVRYQLAFTLGELQRPDKASALGRILGRDLGNPWVQNAVLGSAANAAGNLLAILAGDVPFRNDPVGFEFLRKLTAMIGVSGHQDAVAQAANFIARAPMDSAQVYALLYNLGEGLYRTRSSLALVDTQGALQNYYSSALNLAADPTASEAARTAATRLLGVSTMKVGSVADWLLLICSPPTSPELQSAAIETLSRYEDPQVVNSFIRMWPLLAPIARTRAITALLSREGHITPVLDAVQNGRILASDLISAQRNYLRTYSLPAIRIRALQLLGPVPVNRPEVMQRFKPALNLRGGADRGREIFRLRCAGCHLQDTRNLGNGLGPELLRARTFSKDQLLSSILEPNLAVRPEYATQVVESKEGQRFVGILTDENNWTLTLKQIDGSDLVWPQLNVRSVSSQAWSLMPEGLEQGMSAQDMADLMAYVLKGT
jgi:putative membrane-bound dehydrogenase-like protein